MNRERIKLIALTSGVAALLAVAGFAVGFTAGTRNQIVEEGRHAAIERQILDWIVERNPEAKIRDFNGFAYTLFAVSKETGIEWEWILAVADKESQMHPASVGALGEIGLMQILPSTGKLIADRIKDPSFEAPGPVVSRERLTNKPVYASLGSLGDPRINLRYGALYLKWQKDVFKQWPTTLRAYNRNPDHAREVRPDDRYAEDIAFIFIALRDQFR